VKGKKIMRRQNTKETSGERQSTPIASRADSFDASKAERELGFKPEIDLDRGLKRTVDWYRKEGRGKVA
jgi:nucleoside-diphosphate-sugar epimerase